MAAQTTRAFGERRALGPLNIQNNRPEARPTKPLNQQSTHYTNYLAGQENQFSYHENKASLIYDEGIYSQEISTKPCDDERLLSDNIEAVKKELNSFLIDTIEKNSSEISERESNKENRSTLSYVEDSFMAVDSKENSVAGDSVLDQSEISYVQHCGQFDRFADYADDILPYMLMKERKYMPDPFYMNSQPNINSKMRSILVDWLVDVADEYKIRDETLFLAISYIDRFLSKISISRQEFQLLGTAALFIATKYEEIYPPEIGEFVYITDDSFNKFQILQMEKLILTTLEFDVSTPTANYFLEKFASDLELDREMYCLSKYLCLLAMLECAPFLKYYPSEIALCSILQAARTVGVQIPEAFLSKTLDYERSMGKNGNAVQLANDRNGLVDELAKLQAFAVEHQQQAIQRKYSTSDYCKVAKLANSK